MKDKKKLIVNLSIVNALIFTTFDAILIKTNFKTFKPLIKSPFQDTANYNYDLETRKVLVDTLIDKTGDFDLFKTATDISGDEIKKEIRNILISNPYIDYENLYERILCNRVVLHSEPSSNPAVVGQTVSFEGAFLTNFLFDIVPNSIIDIYDVNMHNSKNKEALKSTYIHESIHMMFPNIESPFFSEALATQIENETPFVHSESYTLHLPLIKMWYEVLGSDVFKKVVATGELQSFIDSLSDLGIDEEKASTIIDKLNDIHYLYLASIESEENVLLIRNLNSKYKDMFNGEKVDKQMLKKYLKSAAEQAINDIDEAYFRQYGKSSRENPIMTAYREQLLYYVDNNSSKYYYDYHYLIDDYNYMNDDKITFYDAETNKFTTHKLQDDDYNLDNYNRPRKEKNLVKIKKEF